MKKILTALLLVGLCGCSAVQLRQEFIGYSIHDVKTSKNKQTQSFDMNASDCITKIKAALKNIGATIRENRRRQYMVADNFQNAFHSAIDTTPVGILVTSAAANKCGVEIASGNIDLAVFVSGEISKKLQAINKEDQPVTKERQEAAK